MNERCNYSKLLYAYSDVDLHTRRLRRVSDGVEKKPTCPRQRVIDTLFQLECLSPNSCFTNISRKYWERF